jgi:hypothetical protein
MLASYLRRGAVVLADNITHFSRALAPYVAHAAPAGGFEYSVWLGSAAPAPQSHNRQGGL